MTYHLVAVDGSMKVDVCIAGFCFLVVGCGGLSATGTPNTHKSFVMGRQWIFAVDDILVMSC